MLRSITMLNYLFIYFHRIATDSGLAHGGLYEAISNENPQGKKKEKKRTVALALLRWLWSGGLSIQDFLPLKIYSCCSAAPQLSQNPSFISLDVISLAFEACSATLRSWSYVQCEEDALIDIDRLQRRRWELVFFFLLFWPVWLRSFLLLLARGELSMILLPLSGAERTPVGLSAWPVFIFSTGTCFIRRRNRWAFLSVIIYLTSVAFRARLRWWFSQWGVVLPGLRSDDIMLNVIDQRYNRYSHPH